MAEVPPFHANINFHAQHSPMGAYFSFTCGHFGSRGGLGLQLGKPAEQDIYIGIKNGDREARTSLHCLPFYQGAGEDAPHGLFTRKRSGGKAAPEPRLQVYRGGLIQRRFGLATDFWQTPDFSFVIGAPFRGIKDPAANSPRELRHELLPAIIAELRIDNRHGKTTKTGCFALGSNAAGTRILDAGMRRGSWPRVGFAWGSTMGVAGDLYDTTEGELRPADGEPFAFMREDVATGLGARSNPVHHLGTCPGIGFEVPAGKCYTLDLALGVYLGGVVTTRLEGRYFYTRYYSDLLDVLDEALSRTYEIWRVSHQEDATHLTSGLSADQQFVLAQAVRSYYGSSQLLDVGGRPFWVVNEGEYGMMNTLDLAVDQMFWELQQNPWVVRNMLDHFATHYSYHDELKEPGNEELHPGGISFCHDMGVHNNFSPEGHSSYELTNLAGCYSYMSQEELCNWILMAASYVAKTGDTEWAIRHGTTIEACFRSMRSRDNPLAGGPDDQNGVMTCDSARCGTGHEITTYDSLDPSLSQARGNLYLAVKCWAAYLGLAQLFELLPDPVVYPKEEGFNSTTMEAIDAAAKVATTVANQLNKEGFIPANLGHEEGDNRARILPAIEGLVYPLFWSDCAHCLKGDSATVQTTQGWLDLHGPFSTLLKALRTHTVTLLSDPKRRNFFGDGGVRLSSTSDNSWLSKIAIVQHVCRAVFGLDERGKPLAANAARCVGFAVADAAHVKWLTQGESARWACSDQFVNGVAKGSRYYPRVVTSVLWLPPDET